MPFKPNYQQQRGDRDRAKAQKKKERLQRREEDAAKRRTSREDAGGTEAVDTPPAPEASRD
jgi:hypothetical protein